MANSLKILWLKSGPLYPLDTGGKIRTHAMLAEISKQHQVTYLAFKEDGHCFHPDEENANYAQEKIWIPWAEAKSGTFSFFKELLFNLFRPLPYALEKYCSNVMQSKILQLDKSGNFDLIVCDFLVPATNVYPIHSRLVTPAILFQHNIESEIWRRLASTKTNPVSRLYFGLQCRRMFKWEKKLSQGFNGVITVSPNDSDFCRDQYQLPNVIGEVPTGVDINFFRPSSRPADSGQQLKIAFLGSMDWMPNIECVQYFTAKVFPLVLKILPETRFIVIGRNPTLAVRALAENDSAIELTGSVEDIRDYLHACNLMVVPLRAGGGTRIKIFEAMAMGVPVVSTTIGAEGLPVTDGENILIADTDQSLADACVQLLQNPELAEQIASAARDKVEIDHSWQAVSECFVDLCRPVIEDAQ